jgi:hypothetical protein
MQGVADRPDAGVPWTWAIAPNEHVASSENEKAFTLLPIVARIPQPAARLNVASSGYASSGSR